MNSPGFMALVTWVKFLGEKLQVTILLTEFFEKRQFFGSSFSFKRLKSTRRLLIKHHMHMLRVYGLKTFAAIPPSSFCSGLARVNEKGNPASLRYRASGDQTSTLFLTVHVPLVPLKIKFLGSGCVEPFILHSLWWG